MQRRSLTPPFCLGQSGDKIFSLLFSLVVVAFVGFSSLALG